MNKAVSSIALVALAAFALPAQAQPGKWTGCHIAIQGGYAMASTEISVPGVASFDGLSSQGAEFVPAIGCDAQIADRFILGGFLDYAVRSVDTKVTLGGLSESVGLENAWSVGGRAGLLLNPSTLAYGLVAYQRSDFDDAGTGLISDLSGVAFGGGIETEFHPGWALRAEYRYVDYSNKDIGGVSLDTNEHTVRAGIVWRPFSR